MTEPKENGFGRALLCGEGLTGASGTSAASQTGRSKNLDCCRSRDAASLPVFLEQLAFRLQPIIHILSMSATALEVDFVCAKFDFLTCGMAPGSLWLAPRRREFFYRLGHGFPLLARVSDSNSTLGENRSQAIARAPGPDSAYQTRVVSGEIAVASKGKHLDES